MRALSAVLFTWLVYIPVGHATFERLIEWDNNEKILCEHYLTGAPAQLLEKPLSRLTRQTFTLHSSDTISDFALQEMGLTLRDWRHDDSPIKLRVRPANEGFPLELTLKIGQRTLLRIPFPEEKLIVWRRLALDESRAKWDHQRLTREYPITDSMLKRGREVDVGLVSDPDARGYRYFMTVEDGIADFGYDVPCKVVDEFSDRPLNHIPRVVTNATEFCRVPYASFGLRPLFD